MCRASVVLQNVVVLCSSCGYNFLRDGHNLSQLVIWYVQQRAPMELGDNERVTAGDWVYVEERKGSFGFKEFVAGDFALDDFAENTNG